MSRRIRASSFLLLAAFAHAAVGQTSTASSATWTGKDSQGHAVVLPAEGKATVVAFLRPGQAQTDDAIKALAALQSRGDLQVLAVVSGDDAPTLATALVKAKWTGPIVIDDDYGLSGKLEVKVWPTTVIVS